MNNYNTPDEEDEKEIEPTPPEVRVVNESFSEEVEIEANNSYTSED